MTGEKHRRNTVLFFLCMTLTCSFYSISYYNLRRINIQLSRNPCSNHTLHNSKRRGELSSPQDKYFHKNITKYVTVIAGANAPFQTGTRCLIIPITFLTIIYTANTIPVTDR